MFRTVSYIESPQSPQDRLMQFPQLDSDQELDRVRTYQAGLKASEKLSNNEGKLTKAERRDLRRTIRAGEAASTEILGSMSRLVTRIVTENAKRRYGSAAHEHFPDLISEATVAVLSAAKNFNPDVGPAFHTYAAQSVRHKVQTLISDPTVATFRVPASWGRLRRRAVPEFHDLTAELGRRPKTRELQDRLYSVCMEWALEHLDSSYDDLDYEDRERVAEEKLRKQGMLAAIRNIDSVLATGVDPLSLNGGVISDDSGSPLSDILPSEGPLPHEDAEELVTHEQLSSSIQEYLEFLGDKERDIIVRLYGLCGRSVESATSIGKTYRHTATEIKEIAAGVREEMRHYPVLRDFFNHIG